MSNGETAVQSRPAWTEPFTADHRAALTRSAPIAAPTAPWLSSRGAGVTVAIIDSGVEADHPAVGGRLVRSVRVELDGDAAQILDEAPVDVVGHGTACAGIIHALVPDADLVSVRVLGKNNRTKGLAFAYGIDWVLQQGIAVANLSLSSRSEDLYATFHDLADQAYFGNTLLVCAASNYPGQASYPSTYASVVSVAAHDLPDPLTWFYNLNPPVEFGAWGVEVPVAWRNGGRIVATGNSFATPHITGLAAKIRASYPTASPFEVKAILAAGAGAREEPAATTPA